MFERGQGGKERGKER
jgi:hypothetical protein